MRIIFLFSLFLAFSSHTMEQHLEDLKKECDRKRDACLEAFGKTPIKEKPKNVYKALKNSNGHGTIGEIRAYAWLCDIGFDFSDDEDE